MYKTLTLFREILPTLKEIPNALPQSPVIPVPKKITKKNVLNLYREILKGRRTLKYTDKNYYTLRIREEFQQNIGERDKDKIVQLFAVRFPS